MLKESLLEHTEICQSTNSKTTAVTLGKRERRNTQNYEDLESSFERPIQKRTKRSSKPILGNACVSNTQPSNPKSAPNSFNGSNNMSPILDLNVKLPQG